MVKYYKIFCESNKDNENENANANECLKHALFQLGLHYDKQRNFDEAIKYYIMASDKGHAVSMNNLGYIYQKRNDYKKMLKYYNKACNLNYAFAMYNLGIYYETIKYDYANCKKYYLMAALNKDQDSINKINSFFDKWFDIEFGLKCKPFLNAKNQQKLDKELCKLYQYMEISEKIGEIAEKNECCICFDNKYIIKFNKCTHGVCYSCLEKIKECPMCREKIY